MYIILFMSLLKVFKLIIESFVITLWTSTQRWVFDKNYKDIGTIFRTLMNVLVFTKFFYNTYFKFLVFLCVLFLFFFFFFKYISIFIFMVCYLYELVFEFLSYIFENLKWNATCDNTGVVTTESVATPPEAFESTLDPVDDIPLKYACLATKDQLVIASCPKDEKFLSEYTVVGGMSTIKVISGPVFKAPLFHNSNNVTNNYTINIYQPPAEKPATRLENICLGTASILLATGLVKGGCYVHGVYISPNVKILTLSDILNKSQHFQTLFKWLKRP